MTHVLRLLRLNGCDLCITIWTVNISVGDRVSDKLYDKVVDYNGGSKNGFKLSKQNGVNKRIERRRTCSAYCDALDAKTI